MSKVFSMTSIEFRALLNLFMCSDPWPTGRDSEHAILQDFLDRESDYRGYSDWVEAYHYFMKKDKEEK